MLLIDWFLYLFPEEDNISVYQRALSLDTAVGSHDLLPSYKPSTSCFLPHLEVQLAANHRRRHFWHRLLHPSAARLLGVNQYSGVNEYIGVAECMESSHPHLPLRGHRVHGGQGVHLHVIPEDIQENPVEGEFPGNPLAEFPENPLGEANPLANVSLHSMDSGIVAELECNHQV